MGPKKQGTELAQWAWPGQGADHFIQEGGSRAYSPSVEGSGCVHPVVS